MDEEITNSVQFLKELSECLRDNGPEAANKLLLKYIKQPKMQDAPVFAVASTVARMLASSFSRVNKKKYEYHILKSRDYAKSGLELDDGNSSCAKSYAVALEAVAKFKGLYKWIVCVLDMQTAWLKALELNPGDPQILHGLGMWPRTKQVICWKISVQAREQSRIRTCDQVTYCNPYCFNYLKIRSFSVSESTSARRKLDCIFVFPHCLNYRNPLAELVCLFGFISQSKLIFSKT
ncbi:hypothetical protein FGIG_03361 [Fasciola gigantica]|uniref:Uncharacterized protein n=1 Tax=Fasciola gigantica TaxID=46835 RepID=A0A504YS37_FASGI|nr:hypothetical protein FGIG_03361 [Fasciola gigantica]